MNGKYTATAAGRGVAAFIRKVADSVPSGSQVVRADLAHLLFATILIRLGLPANQLSTVLPDVAVQDLAAEHSRLLDGEDVGEWFMDSLEDHEGEVIQMFSRPDAAVRWEACA